MWSFLPSVSSERVKAMLALESFESVLDLLNLAVVNAFTWQPFRGASLRGCWRAEFLLSVAPHTYDAFFNSPVSLRAQYAVDAGHGDAATRRILSLLQARLLSFGPRDSGVSDTLIQWSLAASQAKIWIDEDEAAAQLGKTTPDIQYPPWERNSDTGVGLLAPYGTQLVVMGGWLDATNVVRANPAKEGRSTEIHHTGFS
jgi:hypothetical protein